MSGKIGPLPTSWILCTNRFVGYLQTRMTAYTEEPIWPNADQTLEHTHTELKPHVYERFHCLSSYIHEQG